MAGCGGDEGDDKTGATTTAPRAVTAPPTRRADDAKPEDVSRQVNRICRRALRKVAFKDDLEPSAGELGRFAEAMASIRKQLLDLPTENRDVIKMGVSASQAALVARETATEVDTTGDGGLLMVEVGTQIEDFENAALRQGFSDCDVPYDDL